MNKQTGIINFIREKKTLIFVIFLVALLAVTVYLFFGTDSETNQSGSQITYTETETKLATILSLIDGVGKTEVYVTESADGITGVIVVCEGGDSLLVKNNVLNAVSTALNINKNLIAIYSM